MRHNAFLDAEFGYNSYNHYRLMDIVYEVRFILWFVTNIEVCCNFLILKIRNIEISYSNLDILYFFISIIYIIKIWLFKKAFDLFLIEIQTPLLYLLLYRDNFYHL